MKNNSKKLLVILGPTATGKSDLAVKLAKKFDGEIISADSRQVYKGLNIGAGKITKKEMQGIPHHLLDVASLKTKFSVSDFKKLADQKIEEIISREKLPILVGGTGFYIDAVANGIILPQVRPDLRLRIKLNKRDLESLVLELKKLDPRRASEIDQKNKVRVIRALEIAIALGKIPTLKIEKKYDVLKIGLNWPEEILHKRIQERLIKRMRIGMLSEVKNLNEKHGVSWKRMLELGLEYRYLALNLTKKLGRKEMLELLETAIRQYSKRQMTWWKRDKEIKWFVPTDIKDIEKEIGKWV